MPILNRASSLKSGVGNVEGIILAWAAITKYHRLGDLKKIISHHSGAWEVQD